MGKWLNGCEICNFGLINEMGNLIDSGLSENKAAQVLSERATKEIGTELFSAEAIRSRYRLHTNKRDPNPKKEVGHNDQVEQVTFDPSNEDDLRKVGELLAEKIESGEAKPRVGSLVSTAVKEALRKNAKPPEPKPINNFDRLSKHALALAEGITFWADGTMKPENEDEAIRARIVLDCAPSLYVYYSKLGVNFQAVHDIFVDPKRRESKLISANPVSDEQEFKRAGETFLKMVEKADAEDWKNVSIEMAGEIISMLSTIILRRTCVLPGRDKP